MNAEFEKWREEANKNENSLVYKCDSSALKEAFLAGAAAMWEQAKREAVVVMCSACNDEYSLTPDTCAVCLHHKAIAAMEYKEDV